MTKERYFELCEMMGNEPIDSQIPVEFDDFPFQLQDALRLYNSLRDDWDYMGGNYIGKNLGGIKDIMDFYDIPLEDRKFIYEFLVEIDRIRAKSIQDAKPKKPSK